MFEGLIPSFLITFREALEAALIVAIIVTYLKKVGKATLSRYAYLGSGAAIILSLVLGFLVQTLYGGLSKVAAELFEGVASLTAVAVRPAENRRKGRSRSRAGCRSSCRSGRDAARRPRCGSSTARCG